MNDFYWYSTTSTTSSASSWEYVVPIGDTNNCYNVYFKDVLLFDPIKVNINYISEEPQDPISEDFEIE